MTKSRLLATASLAALAMTVATAAYAGSNNFANLGEGEVEMSIRSGGGDGEGGSATGGAVSGGNGEGGEGGDGDGSNGGTADGVATGPGGTAQGGSGDGGLGGAVSVTDINANSKNTYSRSDIDVVVELEQTDEFETGEINAEGGENESSIRGVEVEGSADMEAENKAKISANGAEGETGEAEQKKPENELETGDGGDGSAGTDGGAGGDNTLGAQANTNASGDALGGNGGSGNTASPTIAGNNTSSPTASTTNAVGQNADGGIVATGDLGFAGMSAAAGAYSMNIISGPWSLNNGGNAIAAHVGTVSTITGIAPGG